LIHRGNRGSIEPIDGPGYSSVMEKGKNPVAVAVDGLPIERLMGNDQEESLSLELIELSLVFHESEGIELVGRHWLPTFKLALC